MKTKDNMKIFNINSMDTPINLAVTLKIKFTFQNPIKKNLMKNLLITF